MKYPISWIIPDISNLFKLINHGYPLCISYNILKGNNIQTKVKKSTVFYVLIFNIRGGSF